MNTQIMIDPNLKYHKYLYEPDPTLTRDGCCQTYPLDRDYWNNQLLDRNFLIDYPTVEHIKYPISEGLCTGDLNSSPCNNPLVKKPSYGSSQRCEKTCQNANLQVNPAWTIEEEGLLDGITCQKERINAQRRYWLRNDAKGPRACPSEGLPLLNSHFGQRLTNPCTGALDLNNSLEELEKRRLDNQCCPSVVPIPQQSNWTPRTRFDLLAKDNLLKELTYSGPWSTSNRRNVDAETALIGINYLNNADCYPNKICSDPLQAKSDNLYAKFFQDTECIYPNYTPKFWDNLTKARSGAQLVTCPPITKNPLIVCDY